MLIFIYPKSEFHKILGPSIMVAFAFLGNTLFLTILVSMLSNTFSNISANAVAEMQFRKAVLTLEGVKADAVFAYQPPFNILAVFVLLPLKFVVSPRWFHKIHVATVKTINLPVLLIIAIAERRLLWPPRGGSHRSPKSFWRKWNISAQNNLRAVFELAPPEDVAQDIAVDDEMTRHLIRRQFTRQNTNDFNKQNTPSQPPSRRDSTFPGIRKRLRGSFTETDDFSDRLDAMEKTMARLEAKISRLLPDETAVDDDDENQAAEEEEEGIMTESSYGGPTQTNDD
jgi:hypothetical protein